MTQKTTRPKPPKKRYAWTPRDYINTQHDKPESFGQQPHPIWHYSGHFTTNKDINRLQLAQWQHTLSYELLQRTQDNDNLQLQNIATELGLKPGGLSYLLHGHGPMKSEHFIGLMRYLQGEITFKLADKKEASIRTTLTSSQN